MDLLVAHDLRKSYHTRRGSAEPLCGVDLSLSKSQCVVVTGPSGSGKTTLLLALAGMLRLDDGKVEFEGNRVDQFSHKARRHWWRRRVGFVFQSFHLVPYLSATDNVALAIDGPGRRRRAHEVLAGVGLSDRYEAKPITLSAGEQQRVAIARAMANNPDLLLADEPTGNLDTASSDEVYRLFQEFQHRGGSLVIVSHQQATRTIADRVLELDQGKLNTVA